MSKGYLYDNGDELITREDIPSELPSYTSSVMVGRTLSVKSGSDGNKLYWSETIPNAVGASLIDGTGATEGHKFLILYKRYGGNVRLKNSELSSILSTYDFVIALLSSIGDVITIRSASNYAKVDIKFCYVDSGNLISCNATELTVPNNDDNVAFDITDYLTTTSLSGGGGGGSFIITETSDTLNKTWTEILTAMKSQSCIIISDSSEDPSPAVTTRYVSRVYVDNGTYYVDCLFINVMGDPSVSSFTTDSSSGYPQA